MKRVLSTTCLAAVFAVGLAAQQTSGTSATAQDPQTTGQGRGGGPRTVSGCLRAGDTAGTYQLTNVQGLGGGRRGAGDTTTTGAPPPPPPASTGTTAGAQGRGGATLMLAVDSSAATSTSSLDLKPHVGHQIEVTGTISGGRGPGAPGTTTGTATGTGTSTGGGGTTTGGGGTTTGTGTGTGTMTPGARGGMRTMTITSIKMLSNSCSQ